MALAKGLAAFLNSTLVDVFFRQFNGHTQVNATDLRSLKYPTRAELETLGRRFDGPSPEQAVLDELMQREFF
jgi:adenine-specific DNA-methyltransferase